MPIPRYYRLSVSTGTNCPHDISPSLEAYVRASLPRTMSPWQIVSGTKRDSTCTSPPTGLVLSLSLHRHPCLNLRCENRPANWPASRETGLEIPCCPSSDLLWVQVTQSYPNQLRFSSLPCPQSPCHTVIDPVFKEGFFPRLKLLFRPNPSQG
jgi:hypothetical protein